MWEYYWAALQFAGLLVGLYMLLVFGIALFRENNGLIDSAYGLAFVGVSFALLALWEKPGLQHYLLVGLITLWGVRLSLRIFLKNWKKPEDFRYRAWRETWKKKSMLYFFFRSLIQIYLLQGVVVLIVLSPVLLAFSQTAPQTLSSLNWLGLGLWCLGFFFEVVGDWQLDRFLKNPVNQGKIMTSGLWSLTRHPNYFGEASMWWGIWFLAFGLPLWAFALASPLLITFLLLKVSGIPLLEKRWEGRPDWVSYARKTNAFFPWLPRKEV